MANPFEHRLAALPGIGEHAFGYVDVIALWYPSPHNCWRVEVWGNDLSGELQNMTVEEATALNRALTKVLLPITWGAN